MCAAGIISIARQAGWGGVGWNKFGNGNCRMEDCGDIRDSTLGQRILSLESPAIF